MSSNLYSIAAPECCGEVSGLRSESIGAEKMWGTTNSSNALNAVAFDDLQLMNEDVKTLHKDICDGKITFIKSILLGGSKMHRGSKFQEVGTTIRSYTQFSWKSMATTSTSVVLDSMVCEKLSQSVKSRREFRSCHSMAVH